MTPEQRLDRAERILLMMAKAGDRTRREWRAKINILIDMQIRHEEERKATSRAQDDKINILIHAQMETTEHLDRLSLSQQKTDEAVRNLTAETDKTAKALRKTEEALRAFLNRSRRRNGDS